MSDNEIWRPIPGYETFYEASSLGRVRGLDRRSGQKFVKGGMIKPSSDGGGYTSFSLCRGNKKERVKTHRAVCMAFHGMPEEGACVRHLNGDRRDNRAANLAWGTRAENEADKLQHGSYGLKLSQGEVRKIRELSGVGLTLKAIGAQFGVSGTTAWRIVRGKSWGNVL